MKTDSFRSQLQAVLTTFYEDMKGVQGASCCAKPKPVRCRFQGADEAGTTPEEEPDVDAAAAAPAAAALEDPCQEEEPQAAAPAPAAAPSPAEKGAGRGRKANGKQG